MNSLRRIFRRTLTSDRALRSRWLRLVCLLGYAFSLIGLPLPTFARIDGKDRSTPYPCQDRPCGCRSAYQCWTQCCCTTPAERVLWAKSNGVAIPEYAVLPPPDVLARLQGDAAPPSPKPSCPHCQPKNSSSCCTTKPAPTPKSGVTVQLVLSIAAARCQGLDHAGLMLPPVHVPCQMVNWSVAPQRNTHSVVSVDPNSRLADPPPSPPPRLVI